MSYDPLTININLLSKHESNVWQNPNDPDDENEHFKQLLIAIELAVNSRSNKLINNRL